MKSQTILAVSAAILLGMACEQNPYPSGVSLTDKEPASVVVDRGMAPATHLEMEGFIECHEGLGCEMAITPSVPQGFTPKITITGLPAGAAYDLSSGRLSYTPGYDVIDLAADPAIKAKKFSAEVSLATLENPAFVLKKNLTMVVYNTLRPVTLDFGGQTDFEVSEEKTLTVDFAVRSEDFPHGPFGVALVGQPSGMMLTEHPEKNRFTISYKPSRKTVTSADPVEGLRRVKMNEINAFVVLPSKDTVSQSLSLKVTDDRMPPLVTGPETIRGASILFSVRADDLNGEEAPLLREKPSVPYGRIRVTESVTQASSSEGTLPYVIYEVHWDQIPKGRVGEATHLPFVFCSGSDGLNCGTHNVKATVGGGA